MDNKYLWTIIIVLLLLNFYTLNDFYQYKSKNEVIITDSENEINELSTLKTNFVENIYNNNIKLSSVLVRDTTNTFLQLKSVLKSGNKYILVCKFSESNCESCVESSINELVNKDDLIDISNILFIGTYRNNKIFKKHILQYGIHNLKTYNSYSLNIPAEDLNYPYYFVIDSSLSISNLFFPNKAIPQLTDKYLKLINEKYFNGKQ